MERLDSEARATVLRKPYRCPASFREIWVYVDGASKGNPGPAGIGVVVRTPEGDTLAKFGMSIGEATNNYAEYTAVVHALRLLSALEVESVAVFTDSELVARQLSGEYRVREQGLRSLHFQALNMLSLYPCWKVKHIGREENREADRLASRAAEESAVGTPGTGKAIMGKGDPEEKNGEPPRLF